MNRYYRATTTKPVMIYSHTLQRHPLWTSDADGCTIAKMSNRIRFFKSIFTRMTDDTKFQIENGDNDKMCRDKNQEWGKNKFGNFFILFLRVTQLFVYVWKRRKKIQVGPSFVCLHFVCHCWFDKIELHINDWCVDSLVYVKSAKNKPSFVERISSLSACLTRFSVKVVSDTSKCFSFLLWQFAGGRNALDKVKKKKKMSSTWCSVS